MHGRRRKNVFLLVTDFGECIFRVAIRPRGGSCGGAVAIGAIHLHRGAVGPAANGPHVDGMIQQDGAGISCAVAKSSEFGMAVREGAYVGSDAGAAAGGAQVRMTFRAGLIGCGADVDAPAMLGVARGTLWDRSGELILVMQRAVVAGLAGGVGGLRGKFPCFLNMERGAFFFEDGVGVAHASAGVDAGVAESTAPNEPAKSKKRCEGAEQETDTLVRRRPREVIEVDALCEFLSCSCARHLFSFVLPAGFPLSNS